MSQCHKHPISSGIRVIYLVLAVVWLSLVSFFRFWELKPFIILTLPIILFGIGILDADCLTLESETDMFKTSFLSVGVIIILPLLSWISKDYNGNIHQFLAIIVISIISSLLSLIDIWLSPKYMSIFKHFKSGLQVISITTIVFGLVTYFMNRPVTSLT